MPSILGGLHRALAASLMLIPVFTYAAQGGNVAAGAEQFYIDYWDRVVGRPGEPWPYLGGHGDAVADLALGKFPNERPPSAMTAADQGAALRAAGSQALAWDRDGVDVLFLQRLFIEIEGVLHACGASPAWVDPRTCAPVAPADGEAFAAPPWWPAGGARPGLNRRDTEELTLLGSILCLEANRRADVAFLRATEDLAARLSELDAATEDLARPAAALRGQWGAAGDELVLELTEPPPAATALEWVDEMDRILGLFHVRRRLRPDLDTMAAAYERELRAQVSWLRSPVDCADWVGMGAALLDEGVFTDAWIQAREDRIRVEAPAVLALDGALEEAAAQVIARIAAALYVAARRSADAAGVELLRQEALEHPIWTEPSPEERAAIGPRPDVGDPRDPNRVRRTSYWVGNPFDLRVLWKRSVDDKGLAAEFGAPFGEALAAHRDRLRDRVLRFDAPETDREALRHAVARLGIDRVLAEPLDGVTAARLFPWLPAARLAELQAAWPALLSTARAQGAAALASRAAESFGLVRDLPPPPMALFKARAARELHRCVEPLLTGEALAPVEAEFLHARRNLLDAAHTALAAELGRRCAAGEDVALLQNAALGLLDRLLPGAPGAEREVLATAWDLALPCGEGAAGALLRFGAAYDVMTAVFALESHAAGGSFDSPFDRDVARRVGTAPLASMDTWIVRFREQQTAMRVRMRRDPAGEPDDRIPLLLHALPQLIPQPDDRALAGGNAPTAAWAETYRQALRGRGYAELAATGWRSLDDYIEEAERHRRIDVTVGGGPGAGGFTVRAVFAPHLPASRLLDGEGRPAEGAGSIIWRRLDGDEPRYQIEVVRPEDDSFRVEVQVPPHPGEPGPRSIAAARRFVELYWRLAG